MSADAQAELMKSCEIFRIPCQDREALRNSIEKCDASCSPERARARGDMSRWERSAANRISRS
jgi:hypothetical protein